MLVGHVIPCVHFVCIEMKRITHDEYLAQVTEINPRIEVIGRYTKAAEKIFHRCTVDGHEWLVTPNAIKSDSGCPICARRKVTRECLNAEFSKVVNVALSLAE